MLSCVSACIFSHIQTCYLLGTLTAPPRTLAGTAELSGPGSAAARTFTDGGPSTRYRADRTSFSGSASPSEAATDPTACRCHWGDWRAAALLNSWKLKLSKTIWFYYVARTVRRDVIGLSL